MTERFKGIDNAKAARSATGCASWIPVRFRKSGSRKIAGKKKIPWRAEASTLAGTVFPIV